MHLQCVKSVRIRSFSGPYFPAFGMICSVKHLRWSFCYFLKKIHRRCFADVLQGSKYTSETPAKPAMTCSKLTIKTLEQGVKYV